MTRLDKFKLAQFKLVQVLLVSSLIFTVAHAQNSTGPEGHLVVADPEASALYVYALPGLELTGQLDGVKFDTHAGFLPLSDDRLLFIDQSSAQLLALEITEDGEAAIVGRASVGIPASHLAVDEMMNYVVAGSDEAEKTLTVVDLNSYESVSVAIDSGDPGLAVGGNPAVIYHRHPEGRLEAYRVESILAGNAEPLDTTEIGPAGHGEAISHDLNHVYVATDDGVDSVDVTADGLGDQRTLPYGASGREGGRAYFVRVTDTHLYSYLRVMDAQDTPWQDWQNDIYIIDLSTEEVSRSELGPGLVFRFAISEPYALFFNVHPNGDFAYLLDIDPASTTFHEIVAKVALEPLTKAPQPDASPWEAESRRAALTPDGLLGFVSHGGDGLISVIDTERGEVTGMLEVPSSLSGGGYLIALQPDMRMVDTVGR